jgi:hypothetical protein
MRAPHEAVTLPTGELTPGPLVQDRCATHGCRYRVADCGARAVAGAALLEIILAAPATLAARLSKEVGGSSAASCSHPARRSRSGRFPRGAGGDS